MVNKKLMSSAMTIRFSGNSTKIVAIWMEYFNALYNPNIVPKTIIYLKLCRIFLMSLKKFFKFKLLPKSIFLLTNSRLFFTKFFSYQNYEKRLSIKITYTICRFIMISLIISKNIYEFMNNKKYFR